MIERVTMMLLLLAAGTALAQSPGDHYPGSATRPSAGGTNAPYARTITVYGNVNTNDLLRFMDRTGSRVAGTNVLGALEYYGTNWQATAAAEAAARAAGDTVARTNLQAALTAEALARVAGDTVAMTNWQARVNALTNGAALGATAWQNPPAASDWTWTSNGREITLTGYSGPNAVVIPDMLDGLPVTGFGGVFSSRMDITSVGGGANIKAVGSDAFFVCENLNSVSLPACTTVDNYAFSGCGNLNSVTFGQNAPALAENVFEYATPTIYVSNPHATGWGDTWHGRPVVRAASMADIARHNTDGSAHADIRALIPELPAAGCTKLTGTNLVISGETYHYYAAPSAHYTLSVSNAAPRYAYSLEIVGTNGWSCTLLSGLYLRGSWTPTGTNVVVVAPGTGTVWNVFGRGL